MSSFYNDLLTAIMSSFYTDLLTAIMSSFYTDLLIATIMPHRHLFAHQQSHSTRLTLRPGKLNVHTYYTTAAAAAAAAAATATTPTAAAAAAAAFRRHTIQLVQWHACGGNTH